MATPGGSNKHRKKKAQKYLSQKIFHDPDVALARFRTELQAFISLSKERSLFTSEARELRVLARRVRHLEHKQRKDRRLRQRAQQKEREAQKIPVDSL